MKNKIDPFTRTPGIAGDAYINMHYAEKIILEFESPNCSKFIYKIVGPLKSGKSVEYNQVLNHFKEKKGWMVYSISESENPNEVLLSKLNRDFNVSTIEIEHSYSDEDLFSIICSMNLLICNKP